MVDNAFTVSFQVNNKQYNGWIEPSDNLNDAGTPQSFHVVLNDTPFADLSFIDCKWSASGEQPVDVVKAIGKEIEKHFKL